MEWNGIVLQVDDNVETFLARKIEIGKASHLVSGNE